MAISSGFESSHLVLKTRRNSFCSVINFSGNFVALLGKDILIGEWLDEGLVDDLSTTKLGKGQIEQEDCLQEPVEWDPVKDGLGPELNHVQEGEDDPVGEQPGVILRCTCAQRVQGQIARHDKASNVGEQLTNTTQVEEDKHKVNHAKAKHSI